MKTSIFIHPRLKWHWSGTMGLRSLLCVALVGLMGFMGGPHIVSAGKAEEYQVKAAFFYHFARFIEWPDEKFTSEADPFRVCIVGPNPFQGELESLLSGKTVHRRSFVLVSGASDSQLDECHVVFVGDVSSDRFMTVTRSLQGKSVLTIGERSDFIQRGGMVRLFVEKSKVRFGINPQATQQANLDVSSKLMRLAKIEEP